MEIIANIAGKGLAHLDIQESQIRSVRVDSPIDPSAPFVSLGFVDIQINGFAGIDFSDADLDLPKALNVLPAVWKTGVTAICATLITNSIEQLQRNFRVLETARQRDARFAATVPAYHLEGPYLSPGPSHGAHDPKLMHPPDWEEFKTLQEAAGGRIAIVTLAPELPGACDFIRQAAAAGVVVALGHTDGSPEDVHAAVEAGARLSTHLGNGCPQMIHRHQNPLWAQLANDHLNASLICDGFHLPPDFVRVAFRMKGVGRSILVTDAVHVAGLPPGRYSLVGLNIELLPSGQVVRMDRASMAGSALSMNRAVAVFQKFTGASLSEALEAATVNPRRLLRGAGLSTSLEAGQPADLVVFRPEPEELRIETVLLRGEPVYSSN
ncbi:MAG TPA: amidohydrolase family protein [Terriglobia bacterium]|nr:amidohydrolase family protein [Terriglobia bacterium]